MLGRFRDFFPKKRLPAKAAAVPPAVVGEGADAADEGVSVDCGGLPAVNERASSVDEQASTADEQASASAAPSRLTPAQRTGNAGEAAAAAFLAEKGHRVLERNWRAGRDEIDLITQDGPALVFVEVRTRAENALVGGFHSIDARKKTALRRVCGAYLKSCHPRPQTYRLDVVQIHMGKSGQMTIHHYAGVALFN